MPTDSKTFRPPEPPEPWRSFLRALDSEPKGAVTLRCLGGFVVTQQYGIGRSTGDIDFVSISTMSAEDDVEAVGGLGSNLYKKYRVYVQYVGIATPPCDYADRLQEMYPDAPWSNLTAGPPVMRLPSGKIWIVQSGLKSRLIRIDGRSAAGAPLEEFPEGNSPRRLEGAFKVRTFIAIGNSGFMC